MANFCEYARLDKNAKLNKFFLYLYGKNIKSEFNFHQALIPQVQFVVD